MNDLAFWICILWIGTVGLVANLLLYVNDSDLLSLMGIIAGLFAMVLGGLSTFFEMKKYRKMMEV